jgi:hypothetical protein
VAAVAHIALAGSRSFTEREEVEAIRLFLLDLVEMTDPAAAREGWAFAALFLFRPEWPGEEQENCQEEQEAATRHYSAARLKI